MSESVALKLEPREVASEVHLATRSALVLAAWFGLVGGYVDVFGFILRKNLLHVIAYYGQSRDFPWVVPVVNLAILLVVGLFVAGVNRLRPGLVSARGATWLFATLAIWGPLLRMPIFGWASLLVAAGLGRWISRGVAARERGFEKFARRSLVVLGGLLVVLAAISSGRHALPEYRSVASLPPARPGAKNVLLIVLDTVRADGLSLYGYARETTPNLAHWAKRGVRFDLALAPAPWTFPSHATLFTGQWPYKLSAHWELSLDSTYPTLAEYLSSKGYLTAGFAANTSLCSYETGLDRGFGHYEDYPLALRTMLGSTPFGRWLLRNTLWPDDYYSLKWIKNQSRNAEGINRSFLGWLKRQEPPLPFFAFLNYLDAHEPFLAPREQLTHFGTSPKSRRDYELLLEYWDVNKLNLTRPEVTLAHDAYDDCIAHLDRQVGLLLADLDRRGILENTVVIITSDHGEEFGEHGVFNHGYSLYMHEVHVPLLILSPAAPTGRVIADPVSLRDVPATVVDLLGLGTGSPFPGGSLASLWMPAAPNGRPPISPALSEVSNSIELSPLRGKGPTQRGYAMSLVAGAQHYIRDSAQTEELYDLKRDPLELKNLKNSPDFSPAIIEHRSALLQVLANDPATAGLASRFASRYKMLLESQVLGRAPAPKPTPADLGAPDKPGM
jgi:arylsulfatase A-like enzyme